MLKYVITTFYLTKKKHFRGSHLYVLVDYVTLYSEILVKVASCRGKYHECW